MITLNLILCCPKIKGCVASTQHSFSYFWVQIFVYIFNTIYYTYKNRRDGTEKEETRTKYKPEWISRHQKKAQRILNMQEGNMCECVTGKTFYIPQHHWGPSGPTLYPFTVLLKMSVCSLECCRDCPLSHRTPQTSSKAEQIFAQVSAAERG